MIIKEGTMEEINKIVDIVEKYRTFYEVEFQNRAEIEEFISARLSGEQSKIFLALEDGKAIGFVQLYPSYSTVSLRPQWILNDLYVEKEHRSKGVAEALMNKVFDYFKNSAKGFILVTDKTNTTAKRFYEKCGWETGEHDFYTYFYK